MNAPAFARSAYGAQAHSVKTHRDIEYDALARITARLRRAAKAQDPGAHPELVAALDENARLWAILAEDLAAPGNAFPETLRAGLLSLAGFALQHSRKVLRKEGEIAPLIDINTSVMRGLRGEGRAV